MKFKGKIGVIWKSFLILVNVIFVWVLVVDEKIGERILFVVLWILIDALFFIMTTRSYVELDNSSLTAVLGLQKCRIEYRDIISLKETNDPIASFGLSIDRIGIESRTGYVLVSVKEKEKFMAELKRRNSEIVIKSK